MVLRKRSSQLHNKTSQTKPTSNRQLLRAKDRPNNSVFYQPHYNNVKYDDSHKKKEDVLRKVFFKECAKEEEKRLFNGQGSVYGPQAQYSGGHAGIYGANEMAR
jgi:hypothetical protein